MIIYFHGLGSNSATKKVGVLREAGFNVVAPDIPLDPVDAELYLTGFIRGAISTAAIMGDNKITFVGTSLGGYWAARMGAMFEVKQVLVNPSFTPSVSLRQYLDSGYFDYASNTITELDEMLVASYEPLDPEETGEHRTYFIAERDPVVSPVKPGVRSAARFYNSDDHRGDSFFKDVIKCLKLSQPYCS